MIFFFTEKKVRRIPTRTFCGQAADVRVGRGEIEKSPTFREED